MMKPNTCCSCRVTSLNWVKTLIDVMWPQLSSWSIMGNSHSYLGHLCFTVSGEEGEIIDLVLNNEVLLLPLEVLQRQTVLISRGLLVSHDTLQIKLLSREIYTTGWRFLPPSWRARSSRHRVPSASETWSNASHHTHSISVKYWKNTLKHILINHVKLK